jgi:hypothetical protein
MLQVRGVSGQAVLLLPGGGEAVDRREVLEVARTIVRAVASD